MKLLLLLGNSVLLVSTLLPLWNNPAWWVRGLDFPRLQIFVFAAVLTVLGLLFAEAEKWSVNAPQLWFFVFAPLACLLFQASKIAPYFFLWPVQVKAASASEGQPRVRVMAVNVLTPNDGFEALLSMVRREQPDVLLTLESDARWQRHLDTLDDRYPHSVKIPLDNLYGMHLYSQLPLSNIEVAYLEQTDVPSIHCLVEMAKGLQFQLHCMHPPPPSPSEANDSTTRDAELLALAKLLSKGTEYPVIVAGDLNDVAWSKTTRLFCRLSKLLDPRRGRGMFNTFHAKYWPVRWPLDHLFHSDHFRLGSIRRLEYFGSDHFPLLTELVYHPVESVEPEQLTANERHLAEQKIEAGEVSMQDVPEPHTKRRTA